MHSSADVTALVLDTVAYYVRIGLCLAGVAFLLIFLGVVLPAVWSIRPDRRQAATEILTYLLNAAGSSVAVRSRLRTDGAGHGTQHVTDPPLGHTRNMSQARGSRAA